MDIDLRPRRMAGTDLTVSRVVFGAMTFGDQVDGADAARMVDQCRDAGITMFDTAVNYADGRSERLLGQVVKPLRDEVQLATKVGNQHGDPNRRGLHRRAIECAVEESLARLGTDYIDLYYLHRPDWATPVEETLEAVASLVQAGKVRALGQSNYAAWQVAEIQCLTERHGWPGVRVSQPLYNLLARRIEDEYAACACRYGLSNVVYNPLAGGLLTGKHRPEAPPPPGTRFAKVNYRRRYWNADHFAAVEELRTIAADAGMSLAALAFRWLLAQPLVDHVLVGASSPAQLEENLRALDGPAPDDGTCRRVDDVWRRLRGAAAAYNR